MRLRLLIMSAVLCSVAAVAVAQPAGMQMPPPPVEVTNAIRAPLFQSITAIGTIAGNESVVVRPEMAGLIEEVHFEEGQAIHAGDKMFTLEQGILSAEAESAKSSARLGSVNLEREQKLKASGYSTQRALDEARTEARTNQAISRVAQVRLSKTTVRAPFDGVIGLRRVSPGDYVMAGQDMVNIEQTDPVKLEFSVPEVFLSDLKVGMPVRAMVDAYPGRTFEGEIYAIDPQVNAATRTISAKARIPNPNGELLPGLFARITLPLPQARPLIVVPETALVPQKSKMLAYRVVDGKAEMVEVKMGQRNAGRVEVVEGLNDGDTVIVTGQMRVQPGKPVNVVNTVKNEAITPTAAPQDVAPVASAAPAVVPAPETMQLTPEAKSEPVAVPDMPPAAAEVIIQEEVPAPVAVPPAKTPVTAPDLQQALKDAATAETQQPAGAQ